MHRCMDPLINYGCNVWELGKRSLIQESDRDLGMVDKSIPNAFIFFLTKLCTCPRYNKLINAIKIEAHYLPSSTTDMPRKYKNNNNSNVLLYQTNINIYTMQFIAI